MDKIKTDEQYSILTLRRSHRQNLNGTSPHLDDHEKKKILARWPYACYHLTDDRQARPLLETNVAVLWDLLLWNAV